MNTDFGKINLGKLTAWGNPYHGSVVNGTLTLPNGATMPFSAGGECVLAAINGTPAPLAVNTPDDVTAGLRWDNYALLQSGLKYPGQDYVIGWTYKDPTGLAWRLSVTLTAPLDLVNRRLVVKGHRLTALPSTAVQLAAIAVPAEPTYRTKDSNNNPWVASRAITYPAPNGSKAAVTLMTNLPTASAVLELTASGGSATTLPSISSAVVRSGTGVYSYTETNDMTGIASGPGDVNFTIVNYTEQASVNIYSGPAYRERKIDETQVLGACYDDTGNLSIATYVYKYWEEKSGDSTISPSSWTANYPGTGEYSLIKSTERSAQHTTKTITNGAASISYAFDLAGSSSSEMKLPHPFRATTFPTNETSTWNIGSIGVRELYDVINTGVTSSRTPSNSGFLEALKPFSFSGSVFGFGIETVISDYTVEDDSHAAIAVMTAGSALAFGVVGPKSNDTNLRIYPASPEKYFPIVVHPITGAFAFGKNSGFV